MNIATTGSDLSHAAGWAAKIATTGRATDPILAGVLLDATEDGLTLSATDYEVFGRAAVSGMVLDPGKAVVSAGLLANIAKLVPGGAETTVTIVDRGLEVKVGKSRWVLPMLEADQWPAFPDQGDLVGEISGDNLGTAVAAVLPAASTDKEGVRGLLGVEVTFGDAVEVTATDRYRIATACVPWQPVAPGSKTTVLVPAPVAKTAAALLGSRVSIHVTESTVTWRTDTHAVTGRLMADKFVAWRSLVDAPIRDGVTAAVVAVDDLNDATDGVAVMLKDFQPMILSFRNGAVTTSTPGDDDGAADHEKPCELSGPPIEVAVQARYVKDALAGCGTARAVVTLTDNPKRPFVVRPCDGNGEVAGSYRCLMMVMDPDKAKKQAAA